MLNKMLKRAYSTLAACIFPRRPFSVHEAKLFGYRVLLFLDQRTCQRIYMGRFEREETRFLRRFVEKGDICLDVGANVGYYSLLFSRMGASVIAFEPIEHNADVLQLTVTLNGLKNVDIHRCVCGPESGRVLFFENSQTGYSSVEFAGGGKTRGDLYGSGVRSVVSRDMIAIDDLKLSRLDIVKVDVEGFEYAVLQGMSQTLHECRPRLLIIELVEEHLNRFGRSIQDVIVHLRGIGYEPRTLEGGFLTAFLGRGTRNDNFFFVPRV